MPKLQAKQKLAHITKQSNINFLKQTNNYDKNNKSSDQTIKSSSSKYDLDTNSTGKMYPETISVSNHKKDTLSDQNYAEDSHKIRLLNELTARKNPFADLVRISLLLNPREFELPEDYIPDIQFPGSSKRQPSHQHQVSSITASLVTPASTSGTTAAASVSAVVPNSSSSREARYTSYSVKRSKEFNRNSLPLILRTCYVCRKGCRKAPLIHCDYCPLVYHADCIDPPLTILPNTRWMCPNHVEPIAEEKLLTSSSYCERVKLWNHFSKPIDHELIKISFLDKAHHDTETLDPCSSNFIKIGCRVPKRIKREYNRFIKQIDKYEEESESEEEQKMEDNETDATNEPQYCRYNDNYHPNKNIDSYQAPSMNTEPHHTLEMSSTNEIDSGSTKRLIEEHESLLDIALKYMIESSKVLESSDVEQPPPMSLQPVAVTKDIKLPQINGDKLNS